MQLALLILLAVTVFGCATNGANDVSGVNRNVARVDTSLGNPQEPSGAAVDTQQARDTTDAKKARQNAALSAWGTFKYAAWGQGSMEGRPWPWR